MLAELGGALDAHVEQCEDCRARLSGYRQIAGLIATATTAHRAPADWKQRTLARVRAARRARRRRAAMLSMMGAAATAAAIVVVVRLYPPTDPERAGPRLTMAIVDPGGWRGDAHPGEIVRARAEPAGEPSFEIRVYRGSRDLVVRCPDAGPPVCAEPDRSLLVWTVPSVATYQVVFLVSQRPIAAPRGTFNEDIAVAIAGGARVVTVETVNAQ